jgi:hypothetical protein
MADSTPENIKNSKIPAVNKDVNEHEIKVTYLGGTKGLYGCRLYRNGVFIEEQKVLKHEIGEACRQMLRWEDKMSVYSKHAAASRKRMYEEKFKVKP